MAEPEQLSLKDTPALSWRRLTAPDQELYKIGYFVPLDELLKRGGRRDEMRSPQFQPANRLS
jgi:hypothetical protein